jgi:hypothetical protein
MEKLKSFCSKSLADNSNNNTMNSSCRTVPVGRKLKKQLRYFVYLKNKKYFDAYLLAENLQSSVEIKKIFHEKFPSKFKVKILVKILKYY